MVKKDKQKNKPFPSTVWRKGSQNFLWRPKIALTVSLPTLSMNSSSSSFIQIRSTWQDLSMPLRAITRNGVAKKVPSMCRGERVKVDKPRLRKHGKEVELPLYEALSDRSSFSQEILIKALNGISCRNYQGTLRDCLQTNISLTSPIRASRIPTTSLTYLQ